MKKLIIINGTMGAGKTFIGKKLWKSINNSIFIDGDWCLCINPWVMHGESIAIYFDNIKCLINNYKNLTGYDHIIVTSLLPENYYEKFIIDYEKEFEIYHFILNCNEETLINRWNNDKESEWRDKEGLEMSLNMLKDFNARTNDEKYTKIITTDNRSIEKIIKEIKMNIIVE